MAIITLQAINTVVSNLSLRPGSLEDRFVYTILSYLPTDKSLRSILSISEEELIISLWEINSPEDIQEKRHALTSLKKSINLQLKRLIEQQKNPDGIVIGLANIFVIADQPISLFPPGHFYSPIVNPDHIKQHENRIWPSSPCDILGIDFNKKSHLSLLKKDFLSYLNDFNYPDKQNEISQPYDFFIENGLFEGLDARTLFVMLRKFRPQNIIEIGSGFSSLLTAHVNNTWLNSETNFTCIEPFPRKFLTEDIPGLSSLIISKVEDVDVHIFEQLKEGDILFIDSSHVCKTGSDVNFIFFEILPRLKKGVIIHIHDIFLPYEYPPHWVITENRSWNEQYLLRALLMFSNTFTVLFSCSFALYNYPDLIKKACSGTLYSGASFWIKKVR